MCSWRVLSRHLDREELFGGKCAGWTSSLFDRDKLLVLIKYFSDFDLLIVYRTNEKLRFSDFVKEYVKR